MIMPSMYVSPRVCRQSAELVRLEEVRAATKRIRKPHELFCLVVINVVADKFMADLSVSTRFPIAATTVHISMPFFEFRCPVVMAYISFTSPSPAMTAPIAITKNCQNGIFSKSKSATRGVVSTPESVKMLWTNAWVASTSTWTRGGSALGTYVDEELLLVMELRVNLAGENVVNAVYEFDFPARACMFIEEEGVVPGNFRASMGGHSSHVGGVNQVDEVVLESFNIESLKELAIDALVIDRLLKHERRFVVMLPQPRRSKIWEQDVIEFFDTPPKWVHDELDHNLIVERLRFLDGIGKSLAVR